MKTQLNLLLTPLSNNMLNHILHNVLSNILNNALNNRLKSVMLITLLSLYSPLSMADAGAPFGVDMVVLSNGETRHIKYNVHSGETWWSNSTTWKKIEEPAPISRSTYAFSIVSTGMHWRLIRIDTLTGETWKNSSGHWVKFSHLAKPGPVTLSPTQ